MSKILKQYNALKSNNKNVILLFRLGIFYNAINEDASILSKEFNLKIINLSPDIIKCGFPYNQLEKYIKKFEERNIKYQILDNNFSNAKIDNNTNYLKNLQFQQIIDNILKIDFDNITYKQSFIKLQKFQEEIKRLYIK